MHTPLKLKTIHTLICSLLLLLSAAVQAQARPTVVTSIKPIHSLVSAVMQGVAEPHLLVEGAGSPHGYALKPSQANLLMDADLVFWVAPTLESFLAKPLQTLATKAEVVTLLASPGLRTHTKRNALHQHDEHEDENDHVGGLHDLDPHFWLDPINAHSLIAEISRILSTHDPINAAIYNANARRLQAELLRLTEEVRAILHSVQPQPYMVFHDAYQYFARRFQMPAVGVITLNPEVQPSIIEMQRAQQNVRGQGVVCVFVEPQFPPALVRMVREGSDARIRVLDPLGATLQPGSDLYFTLIRVMARAMRDCLNEKRLDPVGE
ncbi:MAG: zinc ABC transporter substrate-binding protein [Alphaproteobacteria bacterium]|nr:zinc ABC transporter substrate-binding protein [Alphaproteobacteria bacterium]